MDRLLENYFFLSLFLGLAFFFSLLFSLILDFSRPENRVLSGLVSLIPSYLIMKRVFWPRSNHKK